MRAGSTSRSAMDHRSARARDDANTSVAPGSAATARARAGSAERQAHEAAGKAASITGARRVSVAARAGSRSTSARGSTH